MRLLEHEGKKLLNDCSVRCAPGIVVDNKSYINLSYHKERYRNFFFDYKNIVIKAQVPSGSRKKNSLICFSSDYEESLSFINKLYKQTMNGQLIQTLLVEKKLDIKEEHFVSITYDTTERSPAVLLSKKGGINVEENSEDVHIQPFSAILGLKEFQARAVAKKAGFKSTEIMRIASFIMKVYDCFAKYECESCEVNPVILTTDGLLYAGDAKITIDDNAVARVKEFTDSTDFENNLFFNERELAARKIDASDYRGVAGKTFLDLEGDIAILASGGGASLTCVDTLVAHGGKPANYTEYSGNPSREKVRELTRITLEKPGLNGCLVIGGIANFTDIYETLSGFVEGLLKLKELPKYPIIIRRGGPRREEGFEMLSIFAKKHGLNLTLFDETTPMSVAARKAVELVDKWKRGTENGNSA